VKKTPKIKRDDGSGCVGSSIRAGEGGVRNEAKAEDSVALFKTTSDNRFKPRKGMAKQKGRSCALERLRVWDGSRWGLYSRVHGKKSGGGGSEGAHYGGAHISLCLARVLGQGKNWAKTDQGGGINRREGLKGKKRWRCPLRGWSQTGDSIGSQ